MNRIRWKKIAVSGCCLLTVIIVAGCDNGTVTVEAQSTARAKAAVDPGIPAVNPPANVPSPEIPLTVASWEQTLETVAKHQGKIVVLDLWSSSCDPCLAELPNLAKLHEQHGGEVVCLSLNCDFTGRGEPGAGRDTIRSILAEAKAKFATMISSDPDEKLYPKVGIAGVPVVQIYDREGKLAKQFDNEKDEYGADGFTYHKHVVPFVEGLLKSSK